MDAHSHTPGSTSLSARLARHQTTISVLVGAAVAVLTVVFLVAALQQVWVLWENRNADRHRLTVPPPPDMPQPAVSDTPVELTPLDPATEDDIPEPDWLTEANIREAATALIRAGRPMEAIRLLEQAPGDVDPRQVAAALYRRTKRHLHAAVCAELQTLGKALDALPPDRQQHLLAGTALNADLQTWLRAPEPDTALDASLDRLPEPVVLTLVDNALCELRAQPDCPLEIARAAIGAALPQDSLVRAMLPADIPERRQTYTDCRETFVLRYATEHVVPHARTHLGLLRRLVNASEGPETAWFGATFGTSFVDDLAETSLARASYGDLLLLTRGLSADGRALLADALAYAVAESGLNVPAWVLADIPWFRDMPEDVVPMLPPIVCTHPAWLDHLRAFRYEQAMAELPAIVENIGAQRYLEPLQAQLVSWIGEEVRALQDEAFPWGVLRRRLGVGAHVPRRFGGASRDGRGPMTTVYSSWEPVPPKAFRNAVAHIAAISDDPERQRLYAQLATVCAALRGQPLTSSGEE